MNDYGNMIVCPECDDSLMKKDKQMCERCQDIYDEGYAKAKEEVLNELRNWVIIQGKKWEIALQFTDGFEYETFNQHPLYDAILNRIKSLSNENPKLFKDALDLSEDANNKTNDTSERRGNQCPQDKPISKPAIISGETEDIHKTADTLTQEEYDKLYPKKVRVGGW